MMIIINMFVMFIIMRLRAGADRRLSHEASPTASPRTPSQLRTLRSTQQVIMNTISCCLYDHCYWQYDCSVLLVLLLVSLPLVLSLHRHPGAARTCVMRRRRALRGGPEGAERGPASIVAGARNESRRAKRSRPDRALQYARLSDTWTAATNVRVSPSGHESNTVKTCVLGCPITPTRRSVKSFRLCWLLTSAGVCHTTLHHVMPGAWIMLVTLEHGVSCCGISCCHIRMAMILSLSLSLSLTQFVCCCRREWLPLQACDAYSYNNMYATCNRDRPATCIGPLWSACEDLLWTPCELGWLTTASFLSDTENRLFRFKSIIPPFDKKLLSKSYLQHLQTNTRPLAQTWGSGPAAG